MECNNSLTTHKYDNKMDYVIGNPPYIRIHNLEENYFLVKNFNFAKNGMSDMYIVFFELSIRMLNGNGKLCLITPSSFLKSNSGIELRKYIQDNKTLSKVIDLGHNQIFDAATYTVITLFDKLSKNELVRYQMYGENNYTDLSYNSIFNNNKISFDSIENLNILSYINECYESYLSRPIVVKNGFATLANKVFISDFQIKDNLVIDIIKASTGKWSKCIFPYDNNGPSQNIRCKHNILKYLVIYSSTKLLD